MKKIILATYLILGMSLSAVASAACIDISGTYRCNPADAPGVFTTTKFVQTSDLLSVIDISTNGSETTTDEFKLDGESHPGPFGITYTAVCKDKEPLKIIMVIFLLKQLQHIFQQLKD
jgi:hypothetical protein